MAMDMGIPAKGAKAPSEPQSEIAKEMAAIPYEPLLPIEIKLIVWSLVVGAALLVVLCWSCFTFF